MKKLFSTLSVLKKIEEKKKNTLKAKVRFLFENFAYPLFLPPSLSHRQHVLKWILSIPLSDKRVNDGKPFNLKIP